MIKKDDPQIPVKKTPGSSSPSEPGKATERSSADQKSTASPPSKVKPSSERTSSQKLSQEEKNFAGKSDSSAQLQEPDPEVSTVSTKKQPVDTTAEKKSFQKGKELESVRKPKISSSKTKSDQKVKEIKLTGLYAFKEGMSSIYDDQGQHLSVTFLKISPWFVTQVKSKPKDTYTSVQLACYPLKKARSKAQKDHLLPAGFEKGARFVREIRQDSVENVKVGQRLSIQSLVKGDVIKLRAVSKGHGFSGVVKRWGFNGGPASHGSKTHRMGGSVGNRTEPARVMPGKKMPGQYGSKQVTINNVKVVDVLEKEQMVIVKGPVPGARNSLVFMYKSTNP